MVSVYVLEASSLNCGRFIQIKSVHRAEKNLQSYTVSAFKLPAL